MPPILALKLVLPMLVWHGLSSLERYAQTTHSFNRPSGSIKITNPIHPLHGESVTVRQIRQCGKQTRVIVEHPSGGLLSLPVEETSLGLPQVSLELAGRKPLFDPQKLWRLAQWVENLDTTATSETVCVQQHEKVEQRKIDATTAQTPQDPARSHRRTHTTLNKADGTVGGQNTQPRSSSTNPTEEPSR